MNSLTNPNIGTKFDELPDDIIIQIFQYLNATERILIESVCKRWNRLTLSKDSWSTFRVLRSSSLSKTAGAIEKVLSRCGTYLKTLEISEYDANPENVLSFVAQSCPNLVKFSFTDCNFSYLDVQLSNVFRNCPRLTTLVLSRNEKLTGSCFVDASPELKHLDLSWCVRLENEYIQVVAGRCSDLEILDLNYCYHLTMACLEFAFHGLIKLRVLKLCGTLNPQKLQPSLALNNLNQLRELDLHGSCSVNDETLDLVSRSCSYIKEIDVSFCTDITDTGLFYLLKLKHLTDLNLSHCPNITDIGVKLLVELDSLKFLNLCECPNVTDGSVIKVVEGCPNLILLNLLSTNITNAAIQALHNIVDQRTAQFMLIVESEKNCFLRKKSLATS